MRERFGSIALILIVGVALGAGAFLFLDLSSSSTAAEPTTTRAVATTTTSRPIETDDDDREATTPPTTTTTVPPTTTTTILVRQSGSVPGWTIGQPWESVVGMTMFRGNPTRTFYGTGPIAEDPTELWRYPESAMCSRSSAGGEAKVWCGMGWTGQPVVYERNDGRTELIFGAYDRAVHFVDAQTGEDLRPRFVTGDIIKGSVSLDPDGYPLLYFGSRDNKLRVLALDRDVPTELWSLDANAVNGIWNNDWDGNPVVVDDVLYEGGENGWFFAYLLNRSFDEAGFVGVDPVQLLAMPGYDEELLSKSGRNVSIESSAVFFEERVYFANSGGRVVGLDVSAIREGEAPIVFDYYAGGDIDATLVVDEVGHLYVSIEHEPSQMGSVELERNREVGQLVKLDPYAEGDPRLWGLDLTDGSSDSGIWATPALHEGFLYVNTHNGDLLAVDKESGAIVWSDPVGWHSWSSPSVVDETLVVATCTGELRGYSLDDPAKPDRVWALQASPSCLEATPAIHAGKIYLGSRDGFIRAFG